MFNFIQWEETVKSNVVSNSFRLYEVMINLSQVIWDICSLSFMGSGLMSCGLKSDVIYWCSSSRRWKKLKWAAQEYRASWSNTAKKVVLCSYDKKHVLFWHTLGISFRHLIRTSCAIYWHLNSQTAFNQIPTYLKGRTTSVLVGNIGYMYFINIE